MNTSLQETIAQTINELDTDSSSRCSTPDRPSHGVSYRHPSATISRPSMDTSPDTIVLGLWPHATDEPVQHYIAGYKALFPSAKISLLRYSRSSDEVASVLNALTLVHEKPSFDLQPTVLLHLFGNDAATHACQLLRAYNGRTGETLDVRAVVMDAVPAFSAPSPAEILRSPWTLFTFVFTFLWVLSAWLLMYITFTDQDAASARLRQDLHNPLLIPAEAQRCYMDTAKNLMFSWNSVSGDAEVEGECRQYAVKRSLVDKKSHWTGDQERYWLAIEELWESH